MAHLQQEELERGLDEIRRSPADHGTLDLIVRRPAVDEREVLREGQLDLAFGLLGDSWIDRPSRRSPDGGPHPEMQLNIMNSRVVSLLAQDRDRWAEAGDQLFVDLDLSATNLPPGTQLTIGSAVVEVTAEPHRGCAKFRRRFGEDALRFVNSPAGEELNLRGINAKVVLPGTILVGQTVDKV